jgi:hypothetical protein
MSSVSAAPIINALPTTTVFTSPYRIDGTAGDTVTVDLEVSSVTDLFSFQAGLKFNPAMVNITGADITEGGFLTNNGADTALPFPGTIDNTAGVIAPYGWTLLDPVQAKSGSGTLIHFAFKMKNTGFSDLHIMALKLVYKDGSTIIPTNTRDYFTAVVGGNQYTIKIVGNPTSRGTPYSGYSGHTVTQVSKSIGGDTYQGEFNFTVTSYGRRFNSSYTDLFAYFNITIPKSLMSCSAIGQWTLFLDDAVQGSRIATENMTHTTLSLEFAYNTLPQKISILSINIVPEFSTIFLATLLVLATFAAAILGKTTLSAKRKS